MARSRSSALLHTAISAMITAIETYNKPDHKYREETFSILAEGGLQETWFYS